MKHITVVFIILTLVSAFGCAGMTRTQQKTLSGLELALRRSSTRRRHGGSPVVEPLS